MKKFGILGFVLPLTLLCSSCLHAEMAVQFLPPPNPSLMVSADLNNKIKEVVFDQFNLSKPDCPYSIVRIQVMSAVKEGETEIQVVLSYKDKYLADTYNVTLDKSLKVVKSVKE